MEIFCDTQFSIKFSLSANVFNGVFVELENLYYNIIMFFSLYFCSVCVCLCMMGEFFHFSPFYFCILLSNFIYTSVEHFPKLSVYYVLYVFVCVFMLFTLCFFLLFVLRLFKMADIVKVNDPNCTFSFIIIVNNFGLMINWG